MPAHAVCVKVLAIFQSPCSFFFSRASGANDVQPLAVWAPGSVCGSVTHQTTASTLAQAPVRRVKEQVDERLKALELVDHSNRSTVTSERSTWIRLNEFGEPRTRVEVAVPACTIIAL